MRNKPKQILKYGKRTGAILSTAVALSFLSPGEAEAQDPFPCNAPQEYCDAILNPYFQPNDTSLAWYGSGDVDGNDIRDMDDYDLMVSGISNDMADVDGDGTPSTTQDQELLLQFLNKEIEYLPGMWNHLQSGEERDFWNDATLEIDLRDTITWTFPTFISRDFAALGYLFGFSYYDTMDTNIYKPHRKHISSFGRYNFPMYFVAVVDPNTGLGHGMNAFLRGKDSSNIDYSPLNFEDWNFVEPQNDSTHVEPGTWNIPFNQRVRIYGIDGYRDQQGFKSPTLLLIVGFQLDSVGNATEYYHDPDLITQRPTIPPERIKPVVEITYPEQDSTYKSHKRSLEYTLTEQNPDSCWYRIENQPKVDTPCGETITGLQSVVGENSWKVYAKDLFGNTGEDSVTFSVDTTTGIGDEPKLIPKYYTLKQNYPNPFNPETVIEYLLTHTSKVSLVIYNIKGQEIMRWEEQDIPSGHHKRIWNGTNEFGLPVGSGVYLYRLEVKGRRFASPTFVQTKKMVLLR